MKDWSIDYFKDSWVKLGCFVTGLSYALIRNSSEKSRKTVKKYLSSIILIATPWAAVGYLFSERYFNASPLVCAMASVLMVFLVIQIERVIILTTSKSNWTTVTRILLGLLMATIGATLLDQIMFKADIDQEKKRHLEEEVAIRTKQDMAYYDDLIFEQDSMISFIDEQITEVSDYLAEKPRIRMWKPKYRSEYDSIAGKYKNVPDGGTIELVPNPKGEALSRFSTDKEGATALRLKFQDKKDNVRETVKMEIENETTGPLQELKFLVRVISSHWIALVFYFVWFGLLLMLEMLVLFTKLSSTDSDYELIIQHQSDINKQRLEQLK